MSVSVHSIENCKRINWNKGTILSDALEGVKNQGLSWTAKNLGIGIHALRFALRRRGIDSRVYARKYESHPKSDRLIRVPIVRAPDPFLAQEAILDKPDNGCSWPMGDLANGDFHFCGKLRKAGKPYCKGCCKRAYLPNQPESMLARYDRLGRL